ncbi:MAG: hypothetical protein AAFO95_12755 [Cyanobacteria bacterium J06600_6]
MKRLFISTLSILALTSLSSPALANTEISVNSNSQNIREITPFSLVTGSYQGRFKAQGIPAAGALIYAANTNEIEAEDLVRGAIEAGKLTEATLSDPGYLNAVKSFLKDFNTK